MSLFNKHFQHFSQVLKFQFATFQFSCNCVSDRRIKFELRLIQISVVMKIIFFCSEFYTTEKWNCHWMKCQTFTTHPKSIYELLHIGALQSQIFLKRVYCGGKLIFHIWIVMEVTSFHNSVFHIFLVQSTRHTRITHLKRK